MSIPDGVRATGGSPAVSPLESIHERKTEALRRTVTADAEALAAAGRSAALAPPPRAVATDLTATRSATGTGTGTVGESRPRPQPVADARPRGRALAIAGLSAIVGLAAGYGARIAVGGRPVGPPALPTLREGDAVRVGAWSLRLRSIARGPGALTVLTLTISGPEEPAAAPRYLRLGRRPPRFWAEAAPGTLLAAFESTSDTLVFAPPGARRPLRLRIRR